MFSHGRKTGCKGFIVPPLQRRGRWWRQPPKGGVSKMVSTTIAAFHFPAFLPAELAASGGHPLSRFAGLLHGKASHVIFGSLSLPCKSRSLATPMQGAE